MSEALPRGPFSIDDVSPSGGALTSDTVVTLRGSGLLRLNRGIYKPKYSIRTVTALSDEEATVILPCRTMGTGLHRLTFTVEGSNTEYAGSGGTGLQFVCFAEPRHTAVRPIAGPSWQGSPVVLTSTMVNCFQPTDQLYRCNPPPFDVLERIDPLAGAQLTAYGRTREFGRCRWLCSLSFGCSGAPLDVYGPIGNVTSETATCLMPPELNGREVSGVECTGPEPPWRRRRQRALASRL